MRLKDFLQDFWYSTKIEVLHKFKEEVLFEGTVGEFYNKHRDNEGLDVVLHIVTIEDDILYVEVT